MGQAVTAVKKEPGQEPERARRAAELEPTGERSGDAQAALTGAGAGDVQAVLAGEEAWDVQTALTGKCGKPLAGYLRQLRRSRGYRQAYVAASLGIARQTYSHYETGRIEPPTGMLFRLAGLYRVPVEDLLRCMAGGRAGKEETAGAVRKDAGRGNGHGSGGAAPASDGRGQGRPEPEGQERKLLYYFSRLDGRDRKDILSIMQAKIANREAEDAERKTTV